MRRQRVSPAVTGVIAILVFLAAITGVVANGIPGGPSLALPWNRPVELGVQLADADALQPHAAVQIAGVKVGEVHTVQSQDSHALVTMELDPQYADVHSDARVLLRPHGLFGPKYLELVPGTASAPALHPGDVLPMQRTVQPVNLDAVLQELQAPEQHQLKTFINEVGRAAAGRGDDANQLIAATDTLSATLDRPVASLDQHSGSLNDVILKSESFNAAFAQTPLDQLVANSNRTLAVFASNSEHLQSILVHADSSLSQLDAALNGESGNLRALLEEAPSTLDKFQHLSNDLTIFGNNLTGVERGSSDATPGIIAAIENPKSAFSSYDCTSKQSPCPEAQKDYYLRVQLFNLGGIDDTQRQLTQAICGLPVFGIVPQITCPAIPGSGAQGTPGATVTSAPRGSDITSFAAFVGS